MTGIKTETSAKIKDSRGFTVAEALVTVIILLLVSAVVAAGMPTATKAYRNVVITSNAEVIRSTTMSALRNEIATARDVRNPEKEGGGTDTTKLFFYNEAYGSMSEISLQDGKIMYQRYAKDGLIITNDAATSAAKPLVSDRDVYPTFTSVTYDKTTGVVTFEGLVVKSIADNKEMTDNTKYSVRVLVKD